MAFTTTTGANGVVSLVGTSGVDADAAIIYSSKVSIDGFGDNDIIGVLSATGQSFVSDFTVIGGQGDDSITVGIPGLNPVALVNSAIWGDSIETVDGVQVVGSGNDTITVGVVQNSTILGLGGSDTITTADLSNADVNGNEGIDAINVTALLGGVTASFIRGGQQDDTIFVDVTVLADSHINGNKGSDSITVISTNLSNTTVYGGQGNDTIVVTANGTGGYTLSGDLGNDSITGSVNADSISGGDGADTIKGLAGKDIIDGGAGKDSITGGTGADTLTGGADDNTFTQEIGDSVIKTGGTGTGVIGVGTYIFANGVDVITDGKATDVINFGVTKTIKADYLRGTWDGTTFTASADNAFGSAYLFNKAGASLTADTFVVIGDIAAA